MWRGVGEVVVGVVLMLGFYCRGGMGGGLDSLWLMDSHTLVVG